MQSRNLSLTLGIAAALLCAGSLLPSRAHAFAGGGHLGVNLDQGDLHLGVDFVFPLVDLSPNVSLALWPSFAHVFREHAHDVELLGADFPFLFRVNSNIVQPFAGPGLGLAMYGDVTLKFNLLGGLFFNPEGPVRPFAEVALRFIRGTFVDLLFGVLFEV